MSVMQCHTHTHTYTWTSAWQLSLCVLDQTHSMSNSINTSDDLYFYYYYKKIHTVNTRYEPWAGCQCWCPLGEWWTGAVQPLPLTLNMQITGSMWRTTYFHHSYSLYCETCQQKQDTYLIEENIFSEYARFHHCPFFLLYDHRQSTHFIPTPS
jgi:hypothetical protein